MTRLPPATRTCVLLAFMLGYGPGAFSQTAPASQTTPASGTGVVTTSAPVYLFPDATRTPLTTLKAGTTVRIRGRQGDWYRVEFRDARFGERTGYMAAANLQVQAAIPDERKISPPSSASQPARRVPQRTRVQKPRQPVVLSLNGGVQTTSRGFGATSPIRRFEEDGTLTSTYSGDRPIVYDVAVNGGVGNGWSAGFAVTYGSKPLGGAVTAEIPHPFFLDKPRTVSGTTADIRRREVAVHINAGWSVPATGPSRVTVFGGPSYFRLTQGLVTEIEAAETYPFDSASFVSATLTEATQSRWGFNAGVDFTQRITKHVGVGVLARYSRAWVKVPIVESHEVEIKAGGLQVGAGARFEF